jgi:hypothetical protein
MHDGHPLLIMISVASSDSMSASTVTIEHPDGPDESTVTSTSTSTIRGIRSSRMAEGAHGECVVFEDGFHTCTSHNAKLVPLMCDWMATTLAG